MLARADGELDISCRYCRAPLETLGHVLGQCILHTQRRIYRHNSIVEIMSKHYGLRGYKVMVEPRITVQGELLKPDLIATKGIRE